MLPGAFTKRYDQRRLRLMLSALFVALVLPTGAVIWQAYDQLKWESWYQYRGQAEALAGRIDSELSAAIAVAEARSFTDFSFLNVASNASVLNRSPLSALPVPGDVPGVIGYFQVDPNGTFSTPLLPVDGNWRASGLTPAEIEARTAAQSALRNVLAGNALLRDGAGSGGRLQVPSERTEADSEEFESRASPDGPSTTEPVARTLRVAPAEEEVASGTYTQDMFDQLNEPAIAENAVLEAAGRDTPDDEGLTSAANSPAKLGDLRLDEDLQRKNEDLARQAATAPQASKESDAVDQVQVRARRIEQSVLPAAPADNLADDRLPDRADAAITTFESEIDPFQFSLLDSGHLVLFRNVWRQGSRYIQGLLIDQSVFAESLIDSAFRATTLYGMSDLIVGYHDDIVRVIRGGDYAGLPAGVGELDGSLLYRRNLSAPFDSLELVFSINSLPPGPGAQVLAWTSVLIAAVFLGGFVALYRLGLGQIRLARQQQDFVSAVSHELKTPLTSIRMYGEMLKEGWAEEEKRQQYYAFIHDESERLTRLISNVLQLARITRNEPQIDARPVKVGALIDQLCSKIASQVERAGFGMDVELSADAAGHTIVVDEDCLTQIVINLVDNAIKFSTNADVKKIVLACDAKRDKEIILSVRDFGPGIERSQLRKIFKLFYRSESELTRETVGTGIGLSIVHQLVTAMGGSVDVVNREPGAEFRVMFPINHA